MIEFELDPDCPLGRCKKFVSDNYGILEKLYPDKWVVVKDCQVLFTADSSDEMFQMAQSFGMERGSYFYRHFLRIPESIHCPSSLGI